MKTVLITGASDGIGQATARALLARGYRVIAHARSEEKANRAAQTLGGDTLSVWGDLSRMAQVVELARQTAERVQSLDALVNNAGTIQRERNVTADGFETTMAINHFAHMLLTLRLQELLARSQEPRVVTVSSGTHRSGTLDLDDLALAQNWSSTSAYGASKLANVLFAAELAHRSGCEQFISVSVSPGVVRTKLLATGWGGGGGATVDEGARTSVFCVTTLDLHKYNGAFLSGQAPTRAHPLASDTRFRRQFWERSLALLKPWLAG